jgi:hypothetical protein
VRTETIVESVAVELKLTDAEADALKAVGTRLAGERTWWGDEESPEERTVVQCSRSVGGDIWKVRVVDAIGLISVGSLQIAVNPKIPLDHLLYLFEASGRFPRLDTQLGSLAGGVSFWRLIATWFVLATERLLRRDLIRDYQTLSDELPVVVGSLEPVPTARAYYAGRLSFSCRFDEFSFDTALNRVLRAAAVAIAGSGDLDHSLRRRSQRIIARLDGVGELKSSDLRVEVDRRSKHYSDAVCLATHVIRSLGRHLVGGDMKAWAFLLRTPEMVEEGIRRILQQRYGIARIRKKGRRLEGSSLSVNPDLEIDNGDAVADVKYKLCGTEWVRADLYQGVTFATAFNSQFAAIVNFRPTAAKILVPLKVGSIVVSHLTWPANPATKPAAAAEEFEHDFDAWLGTLPSVPSAQWAFGGSYFAMQRCRMKKCPFCARTSGRSDQVPVLWKRSQSRGWRV